MRAPARFAFHVSRALLAGLGLAFAAGTAVAQQPHKPEVRSSEPAWITAGQPAMVRIFTNDLTPTEIRFEEAAITGKVVKTETSTDRKKGATVVEVAVTSGADLKPRRHRFTFTDAEGKSASGSLLVDVPMPEMAETEPNNDLRKPQLLPGPVTVVGKLDGDGADVFRIDARAGETWRFEVLAKRLKAGNQLEAVLRLRDPRMAPIRAAVDQGADCSIEYRIPADGPYVIELFDGDNRTGGDLQYKLWVRKY
jgi:hypothetical protein